MGPDGDQSLLRRRLLQFTRAGPAAGQRSPFEHEASLAARSLVLTCRATMLLRLALLQPDRLQLPRRDCEVGVDPLDASPTQLDFGPKRVPTTVAEASAALKRILSGVQLALRRCARLLQSSALTLEEAATHRLIARERGAFDLRPRFVMRPRGERSLVDCEFFRS